MRNVAILIASVVLLGAADAPPASPAKPAPKYQEGSCCVKAAKAGKVCDHCNEPAKK